VDHNGDRLVGERYRLIKQIGVGSMGVVWLGTDEKLQRPVAIKQLLPPPGMTEETCERAHREARIAARLHHPNAVTVYDVVEEDGLPWLVMEYVAARSVSTLLSEDGPLPAAAVARLGAQLASALAMAHQAGVVHRDVKPGNVLIAEDGTAKLADFGISRATGDVVLTATGLVSGTPAYLAPEVASGEGPTPASDVFSLGATLYAAYEGQPPFGFGDNPLAQLRAVAEGRLRPPTHVGPLAAEIVSLMHLDPKRRPRCADAAATLAVLAKSLAEPDEETERIVRSINKHRRRWPAPVRTITLAAATGVAALAMVATGATAMMMGGHNTAPAALAPPSATVTSTQTPPQASRQTSTSTPAPGTDRARVATTPSFRAVPSPTGTPNATVVASNDLGMFITNYYALLPGHLNQAWALLGAQYRVKVGGFGAFQGFYQTISSVQVPSVRIDGPHTATATLVFTRDDGTTSVERWQFDVAMDGMSLVIQDANPV
jgi:serine/threonine protein kinase